MTVPLATTMRLAQELDDKADYMPSPEEIRAEAAKIKAANLKAMRRKNYHGTFTPWVPGIREVKVRLPR